MPFAPHHTVSAQGPAGPTGIRRVAIALSVVVIGSAAGAGTARGDAVRPMSPEQIHQLTCGHLGVSCGERAKRSSHKARAAARKRAAARR